MLPSLHRLLIHDNVEEDTDARTVAMCKRLPVAMYKRLRVEDEQFAQAEAKKLRIAASVFEKFPEGKVFEIDGLMALMRIPTLIEQTFKLSNWVFSAKKETVKGIRLEEKDGEMQSILSTLSGRFCNKQSGSCGTYNCFEASVGTLGKDAVHTGLNTLITKLQDAEGFEMPEQVSIRSPKKSDLSEYCSDDTRLGRDELALTLHMAATGIGPPILAAFPVLVKGENNQIVKHDYAYVTEDSWKDLREVLKMLSQEHIHGGNIDADVKSISKSTVDLMRLVATKNIVLTDVKLGNMVARRIDSREYEVKMIDFGATFTTNVNMHATEIVERTTEDCIFFVNGLLLVSYLTGSGFQVMDKLVFKQLVEEVVETWKKIENTKMASGFCPLLERDTVYPQDKLKYLSNLSTVPKDHFFKALRNVFYGSLGHYGGDDVLDVEQTVAPDGVSPSYISRLVDKIKILWL